MKDLVKMKLVIVESPSKAEKIQSVLGKDYKVMASRGHIVDLGKGGKHGIGVDVNDPTCSRELTSGDNSLLIGPPG